MEITTFLARFWGSLFMILGGLMAGTGFLGHIIGYAQDRTITIVTGYITFLLGLMTVVAHNLWVADWRLTITILGWVTLLKGLEKIILPERVGQKARLFANGQACWGCVILVIGTWFFTMSFAG